MKKTAAIIVAVLVVLIGIRVAMVLTSHPSDEDQIKQALADSIQDSKAGKTGSLMELLGDQISFNSQDASSEKSQIASFIKKQHPDISFQNETAFVTGTTARIDSPATIQLSFLGQSRTIQLKEVLLIFKRNLRRNGL